MFSRHLPLFGLIALSSWPTTGCSAPSDSGELEAAHVKTRMAGDESIEAEAMSCAAWCHWQTSEMLIPCASAYDISMPRDVCYDYSNLSCTSGGGYATMQLDKNGTHHVVTYACN